LDVFSTFVMRDLDCVVIGGGPAGLAAAVYLARFRRRFVVLHAGTSRADWIPLSHNLPGYPDGIAGRELLARLRAQAERYGSEILEAEALRLESDGSDGFLTHTIAGAIRSRKVLLATGVEDREPDLPNLAGAIRKGLVRHCPVCDAYEATGQSIAIIGYGACSLHEALLLRRYASKLTLLSLGKPFRLSQDDREALRRAEVRIIDAPVRELGVATGRIETFHMEDGQVHRFDTIYSALGRRVRSDLVKDLPLTLDPDGALVTDGHQRTTLPGLYAAGDVVAGLAQIAVATGQAAVAATDIHNRLIADELAERESAS
jgi:thioredoxin reductase (NADPH)